MNNFGPFAHLINLDTTTLIGMLVWGNLAMGILVCLYEAASNYKLDFGFYTRNMAAVRFLSALGYLCLFLRNDISDFVSVNVGNTLVYICQYFDGCMLLEISNIRSKKIFIAETIITAAAVIIFNTMDLVYGDSALRIGMASVMIFAIFFPPIVQLIISKEASKFKKCAGIFYIPLLCGLIPRSVEGFVGRINSIKTVTYYQTLLFVSLVLLMIANTIIYLLFIKEKSDNLIEKMANFDSLTDVMNRHSFFSQGHLVFENNKTQEKLLSLLFLDIDHFKKINDRYGHQFGDDVLVRFAETIKGNIRPADICCRYGGEEFIVLANTNADGCKTMAERILRETENIGFDDRPDFHMTTSIGCITGIPAPDESLENYIDKADKALYRAKNAGRNRIAYHGE